MEREKGGGEEEIVIVPCGLCLSIGHSQGTSSKT